MDEERVSKREKRVGIVVEGVVEVLTSQNQGIYSGMTKKVECDLSLIQHMVPHVVW